MRQAFLILSVFLLSLSFNSCNGLFDPNTAEILSLDTDFDEIKTDNYSMHVPNYMKEAADLNDDASLQYQNVFKETYIIVIEESKEEFISVFIDLEEYYDSLSIVENYAEAQMSFLREGIALSIESEPRPLIINGLESRIIEIDGSVEGIEDDIAYTLAFVEGDTELYMIMAWTLGKRREKYRQTFEQSFKSFKLKGN